MANCWRNKLAGLALVFITCVTTRHRWGPSGICNSNRDCCCPIKIMPGLVCVQFPAKYPQRITFIFLYFYFWHLHMHTSAQLIQNPPFESGPCHQLCQQADCLFSFHLQIFATTKKIHWLPWDWHEINIKTNPLCKFKRINLKIFKIGCKFKTLTRSSW